MARTKKPEQTISKTDAAKAALAEGIESPGKAVEFIKERYGLDMNPQHFSAVKSQIKKKEAEPEPDLLDALESVKKLVAQYGAERVKRMVDLLGR